MRTAADTFTRPAKAQPLLKKPAKISQCEEIHMSIELTIHSAGTGSCSLTGKEGEGMTVTFKDGTVKEAFLSQRAFMQLVRMKAGTTEKPARSSVPVPGNAL